MDAIVSGTLFVGLDHVYCGETKTRTKAVFVDV
jgi:hypothetical protein